MLIYEEIVEEIYRIHNDSDKKYPIPFCQKIIFIIAILRNIRRRHYDTKEIYSEYVNYTYDI